jgi:hypothetical protein
LPARVTIQNVLVSSGLIPYSGDSTMSLKMYISHRPERKMETTAHELHENMRAVLTAYISWYSFFVTINFVVAGWFASKALARKSTSKLGVVVVSSYFIIQCVLGFVGTLVLRSWYGDMGGNIHRLLAPGQSTAIDAVDSSTWYFRSLFAMFDVSIVCLGCFWIILVVITYHSSPNASPWGKQEARIDSEIPIEKLRGGPT